MKQRECFIDDAELHLYLDKELAADRITTIDNHIRNCADCALRYGVSRELKFAIRGICRDVKAPEVLRRDILINIANSKPKQESWFWAKLKEAFSGRPLIPVTLAMSLIIIFCAALFLVAPLGKKESLVAAMAHEHNEYIEGIDADLRIISSDSNEIERWLKTNSDINFKVPRDTPFSPSGACAIDYGRRKLTCLFFGEGTRRISFFFIPGDDSEIESSSIYRLKDMPLRCGVCTGDNFVAWSRDRFLYILISRLPEDTLIMFANNLI